MYFESVEQDQIIYSTTLCVSYRVCYMQMIWIGPVDSEKIKNVYEQTDGWRQQSHLSNYKLTHEPQLRWATIQDLYTIEIPLALEFFLWSIKTCLKRPLKKMTKNCFLRSIIA